jgi:hypothetical protein
VKGQSHPSSITITSAAWKGDGCLLAGAPWSRGRAAQYVEVMHVMYCTVLYCTVLYCTALCVIIAVYVTQTVLVFMSARIVIWSIRTFHWARKLREELCSAGHFCAVLCCVM